MDVQALQYLEAKTKKARMIVEKIELLLKESDHVEQVAFIRFQDHQSTNLFTLSDQYDGKNNRGRLINLIKPAVKKLIAEEIAQLEKELEEI